MTSFAKCIIEDKKTDAPLDIKTPDFSHTVLQFESGHTATLQCSIVAPHDRGLTIIGEQGMLTTDDCWFYDTPVYLHQRTRFDEFVEWASPLTRRLRKLPGAQNLLKPKPQKNPPIAPSDFKGFSTGNKMDFCRGPAEVAKGIIERGTSVLTNEQSIHLTEISLTMQHPEKMGAVQSS